MILPTKKTKGGGINQRLRAEVTLEDDEVFAQTGERELPPSILAKLILNLYVWALIYPHLAQQIAAAAVGDLTNHCRRDFEKILPSMCLAMPLPVFTPLKSAAGAQGFRIFTPLKSAAGAQGFRNCIQWIIWPHEVFSSSYNHADDVAQIVDDTDRDTPPYDDTAQVACISVATRVTRGRHSSTRKRK